MKDRSLLLDNRVPTFCKFDHRKSRLVVHTWLRNCSDLKKPRSIPWPMGHPIIPLVRLLSSQGQSPSCAAITRQIKEKTHELKAIRIGLILGHRHAESLARLGRESKSSRV